MNHDDEMEPTGVFRERLLDVVEGRKSLNDAEIQAAMAADPRFQAHVLGAMDVTRALAALRAAEAEALAAPPTPLEAVAIAAARAGLGLASGQAAQDRPRRWSWLALALAAGILIGALLWRTDGGTVPSNSPTHLGGSLSLSFDEAAGELQLPPLAAGHYYRIRFLAAGKAVGGELTWRTTRLALPSLRGYPAPVVVDVELMQSGDPIGDRAEVAVPEGMIR